MEISPAVERKNTEIIQTLVRRLSTCSMMMEMVIKKKHTIATAHVGVCIREEPTPTPLAVVWAMDAKGNCRKAVESREYEDC